MALRFRAKVKELVLYTYPHNLCGGSRGALLGENWTGWRVQPIYFFTMRPHDTS